MLDAPCSRCPGHRVHRLSEGSRLRRLARREPSVPALGRHPTRRDEWQTLRTRGRPRPVPPGAPAAHRRSSGDPEPRLIGTPAARRTGSDAPGPPTPCRPVPGRNAIPLASRERGPENGFAGTGRFRTPSVAGQCVWRPGPTESPSGLSARPLPSNRSPIRARGTGPPDSSARQETLNSARGDEPPDCPGQRRPSGQRVRGPAGRRSARRRRTDRPAAGWRRGGRSCRSIRYRPPGSPITDQEADITNARQDPFTQDALLCRRDIHRHFHSELEIRQPLNIGPQRAGRVLPKRSHRVVEFLLERRPIKSLCQAACGFPGVGRRGRGEGGSRQQAPSGPRKQRCSRPAVWTSSHGDLHGRSRDRAVRFGGNSARRYWTPGFAATEFLRRGGEKPFDQPSPP